EPILAGTVKISRIGQVHIFPRGYTRTEVLLRYAPRRRDPLLTIAELHNLVRGIVQQHSLFADRANAICGCYLRSHQQAQDKNHEIAHETLQTSPVKMRNGHQSLSSW